MKHPINYIKLAADDVMRLRGCDVDRVLDAARDDKMSVSTELYILKHRPDLRAYVEDWVSENYK
jgi:hypothetical protein